jgi:hypothetical protein
MTLALWVVVGVGLLEAAATWWLIRASRRLSRVDERLGQLTEALGLLTETVEAGFRANAAELMRLAEQASAPPVPVRPAKPAPLAKPAPAPASTGGAKPRTRRTAAAASPRNGRHVKDTAPGEEMSEAELRLRLHLAETVAGRTAGKESGRALRA